MGAVTSTITSITRVIPEITLVSLIAGAILFLILLPFVMLIFGNATFIVQVLVFIAGMWIASKFLNR